MAQIKPEVFNTLLDIEDPLDAPRKLLEIIYEKTRREQLMKEVLEATDYQVDDDTFRQYFEDVHADRRYLKQDFTPQAISKLIAELVKQPNQEDEGHTLYEACAGTGSMTISAWYKNMMKHTAYKPSMYLYHVEEISHRAIPFLIFNLAMRGMNAIVVHCDILSRQAYGAFFIQNDTDDPTQFSSINRLPYTEEVASALGYPVQFVSEHYEPLIESPEHVQHLAEEMEQLRNKSLNTDEYYHTAEHFTNTLLIESELFSNSVEQTYVQQSLF